MHFYFDGRFSVNNSTTLVRKKKAEYGLHLSGISLFFPAWGMNSVMAQNPSLGEFGKEQQGSCLGLAKHKSRMLYENKPESQKILDHHAKGSK